MGLFGRRAVELSMPSPTDLYLPDVVVLRKPRLRAQMGEVTRGAAALIEHIPEQFKPAATAVTEAISERLDPEPPLEAKQRIAHAVAFGMALAGVEYANGWQWPRQMDAVIHTTMIAIGLDSDEANQFRFVESFALRAGYWIWRISEGSDGAAALDALIYTYGGELQSLVSETACA